MSKKTPPRKTPNRDSRYMGLAWVHAAFSKDPKTQVGAVIVDKDNFLCGSGYNGPPRNIPDDAFSWARGKLEEFSKNDVIVHAEINALDHYNAETKNATLYVTALPCPPCMLTIVRKKIARVVYMNWESDVNSSLRNPILRKKALQTARLGKVKIEEFKGNLDWIQSHLDLLKTIGAL